MAIEWVDPKTGEPVPFAESQRGDVLNYDSFVNHTFVFRALNDRNNTAELQYVTIGPEEDEQVIVVKEDLEVERLDATALHQRNNDDATAMVQKCRQRADQKLAAGQSVDTVSDDLVQCLEREAARLFEVRNEELAFQRQLRKDVANLGENYTCADQLKETTTPKEVVNWTYEGEERTVGILHQRPDSQIHILHDFISEEECLAIQEAAEPKLHRGTVADGKGGSRVRTIHRTVIFA